MSLTRSSLETTSLAWHAVGLQGTMHDAQFLPPQIPLTSPPPCGLLPILGAGQQPHPTVTKDTCSSWSPAQPWMPMNRFSQGPWAAGLISPVMSLHTLLLVCCDLFCGYSLQSPALPRHTQAEGPGHLLGADYTCFFPLPATQVWGRAQCPVASPKIWPHACVLWCHIYVENLLGCEVFALVTSCWDLAACVCMCWGQHRLQKGQVASLRCHVTAWLGRSRWHSHHPVFQRLTDSSWTLRP